MQEIKLPGHKTKTVCTIGPASRSETVLEELVLNGMNVARLNFAHGSLDGHRDDILRIREAAAKHGRSCLILADLPGPKIRIGTLLDEPVMLLRGETVTLTTHEAPGTASRISVNYPELPACVKPGDIIFLNDGFLQLKVLSVNKTDVECSVLIGGALYSRKGLSIPGARLLIEPVTGRDLDYVDFCLKEGIDTFSVSFVEKADDLHKVRVYAKHKGFDVRIVAKIERMEAVSNIDEIIAAADALMIARGDLGVQIPLETVPTVQKKLIHKANCAGIPVITATQMLVSMTDNIRPTRAEVSDVANAILDGTDAVMLSEETAMGKYPIEALGMMTRIAASTEREIDEIKSLSDLRNYFRNCYDPQQTDIEDVISLQAVETACALDACCIVTTACNGSMPRRISRFRPACWTLSVGGTEGQKQFLELSYGVLTADMSSDSMAKASDIIALADMSGIAVNGQPIILADDSSGDMVDCVDSMKIIRTKPDLGAGHIVQRR